MGGVIFDILWDEETETHRLKAAKLPPKSVVGIYGIGALGSLGVQFAKAMACLPIPCLMTPESIDHE